MSVATVVVVVVGVALTIAIAVAAETARQDNEERLLRQRTREAAAVLEAAVPGVEAPLATAAALAEVLDASDAEAFEAAIGAQVGSDGP